ncbi:MAG: 4-alpha-glucanotransferase, partial [Shewanella sp.]
MGLEKLLYLRGVGADFTDCFGQYIRIPEADRQGILTCMLQEKNTQACEVKDEPLTSLPSGDELDAQVYQLDAHHWTQVLPAFHWCYVDEPWVCLYLPQSYRGDLLFKFACEQGEVIVFKALFSALKPIGDYRIEKPELARHGDSPFADECQFIQYRLDLLAHEFDCGDASEQGKLSDVSCLGLGYHKVSVSLGDTTSTLGDCTSG